MSVQKLKAGMAVKVDNKDYVLLESYNWKSADGDKVTVGLLIDIVPNAQGTYDTKAVSLTQVKAPVAQPEEQVVAAPEAAAAQVDGQ